MRRSRGIEALDPELGALVDTRFDRARAEARGVLPDGPFRGVPMLVKDGVQHSAGDRYQHGMRFLRDREHRSPADTELVRRYRAAGFVILGRTKVPELTAAPTTEPLAHGPGAQPLEPRAQHRGLERRVGRGGGVAHGSGCPRQRHGRFDPHPRVLLRAGGAEAEPPPQQSRSAR